MIAIFITKRAMESLAIIVVFMSLSLRGARENSPMLAIRFKGLFVMLVQMSFFTLVTV